MSYIQTGSQWLPRLALALALALPVGAGAQSALPPDLVERLELLDTLKARGLISKAEHGARRESLLDSIAPAARGATGTAAPAMAPDAAGARTHRYDGDWRGVGLLEVNEDGRCPNVDIALTVDGGQISGTVTGRLIGEHRIEGHIDDAGIVSATTTQGNYNIALDGLLEDGDWSFTFCSGSFSLAHQGG